MHKTAPTTGTGWSVGLMLAIALFGIGSSVFVLRSDPVPLTAGSAATADAAQAFNSEKSPASEMLPASSPASSVPLAADVAAPAASALAAPVVPPTALPSSAPAPQASATKVASVPASAMAPAATVKDALAAAPKTTAQSVAVTRPAPAAKPAKPAVRKPVQREPVSAAEGVTEDTDQAPKPLVRPATLLPSPRTAKVQELDQASPTAAKTEPSAKAAAPSDVPKVATVPVEQEPSTKRITAEPLVKTPFKPVIVMATEAKVWVRVTDQQTLIFEKGQNVPSFGVFKESDGKSAKFDTGTFPVNPTE